MALRDLLEKESESESENLLMRLSVLAQYAGTSVIAGGLFVLHPVAGVIFGGIGLVVFGALHEKETGN